MVYENVDANFKVAFARVVIEGSKKELMPPPLNLLRKLVLHGYAALQPVAHDGFVRAVLEWRWLLDVLPASPTPWS